MEFHVCYGILARLLLVGAVIKGDAKHVNVAVVDLNVIVYVPDGVINLPALSLLLALRWLASDKAVPTRDLEVSESIYVHKW